MQVGHRPRSVLPQRGGTTVAALRLCNNCCVQQECLEYALENEVEHGIWGGLSTPQREKQIRAQRDAVEVA